MDGSIPACAGEPATPYVRPPLRTVYPRVCGGTVCRLHPSIISRGLSPRVRGNPVVVAATEGPCRSIPACAGEPRANSPEALDRRVYPRVCGGTNTSRWLSLYVRGLSPRVRGNPDPCVVERPRGGSIPACAGEPEHPQRGGCSMGVYPRVCGGTASWRDAAS